MGGAFSSASTPIPERTPKKFLHINDDYKTLGEVTNALRENGLESSNLIVGIDFTKSNEWTGKKSFNGKSLHEIGTSTQNPYEQGISIIGRTLSSFDEDNLIPCFGFGDVTTHDQEVFSFYPDNRPCLGFEQALSRYREIVPQIRLSGPTSFAPIISAAIDIVEKSGGQYHILLIIADGQVTRSVEIETDKLSPQESDTISAIVEASKYALSIVLVGVGDGPWDTMIKFDDNIPERSFDNFQFVNFTEIMSKRIPDTQKEPLFALHALMEIPSQFEATKLYRTLNRTNGRQCTHEPRQPPVETSNHNAISRYPSGKKKSKRMTESGSGSDLGLVNNSEADARICPVCLHLPKNTAFDCGHQTCQECSYGLTICPICRQPITRRIKLY